MAATIPKMQMAQVIEKAGSRLQYKEVPVQTPGPDEVLVNVKVEKPSASNIWSDPG